MPGRCCSGNVLITSANWLDHLQEIAAQHLFARAIKIDKEL
jgi:hypothetical protein